LGLAALAACRAGGVTFPETAALRPGTYVLSELGGSPAPFVYLEVNYADTLRARFVFAFDTVRIESDSSFTRHFRREAVLFRPGQPPFVADSEAFRYPGIILYRGDEVKLTTRLGSPGGVAVAYFVPRDTALARHTQLTTYYCLANGCAVVSDRRADAWYARR
jgi:hypothetical protein